MTAEPEADITASATRSPSAAAHGSRVGLLAVFGSTFFELCGIFMLSPLLLLMLKDAQVSTTVAGLFAATTWLGVFIITPFASQLTRQIGRRPSMWLASATPLLATLGFMLTDALWVWFALQLMAGVAGGLRWVLAEAFIAEFAPPQHIGRTIGTYATLVGLTFVVGPVLLAAVGTCLVVAVCAARPGAGLDGADSAFARRPRPAQRPGRLARLATGGAGAPGDHAGGFCRRIF